MKYSLILAALLLTSSVYAENVEAAQNAEVKTSGTGSVLAPAPASNTNLTCNCNHRDDMKNGVSNSEEELSPTHDVRISVTGEGVAPINTSSPAQAYALAKRAAVADAYRMIAEKVKGVRVEGQDLIKNMMVQRSTVRTSVDAMVRNANIVETNFKEGLCEVEMEIIISYSQFAH